MKTFLLVLAICTTPDGALPFTCIPSENAATVYEYPRMVDCVRQAALMRKEFQVEVHCAGDEVSPADLLKG